MRKISRPRCFQSGTSFLEAGLKRLASAATIALARRPLLLIYQMGKVGSQTIEATLRDVRLPHRIHRIHFLSPRQGEIFEQWLTAPGPSEATKASLSRQLEEARALYSGIMLRKKWAFAGWTRRKIDVVVGVREPVSLLLASVFQNYGNYFQSLREITAESCRNLLLMDSSLDAVRHRQIEDTLRYVHDWFEVELRSVLGIDVYSKPFAHGDGCALYENALARVLVYRYEDFDRIPTMLEDFLGSRISCLTNRNIGAEKDYGDLYRTVKKRLRLPMSFLAGQYDSRLARHFYSLAEREKLTAQWSQ
jgi:hypothetical protein